MKKSYWFLFVPSAILYALPFLFNDALWWLIFIFPIPLLYITCTQNLSFIHGYVWGIIVFSLHVSGGICIVVRLSHEAWLIGVLLGIGMVLYQALVPAMLFSCITMIVRYFVIHSPMIRIFLWTLSLALFFVWIDQYCMWVFGIKEGYPLMHPLLPLAQQPRLLLLLPMCGKQLTTIFFLCVAASCVLWIWYKNFVSLLFFIMVILAWLYCWCVNVSEQTYPAWYNQIKSLPCMAHVTGQDPTVVMKVIAKQLKEIVMYHPHTDIIAMPESALNITDFERKPELLQLWNADCLGKPIHIIFGTCRWKNQHYCNSLHWVYNGILQTCCDKKHAMLITERLPDWMSNTFTRTIYFRDGLSITRSCDERMSLCMSENLTFIPYICSEFFFNERPDDHHDHVPMIVIVNDMLFMNTYLQKLLLLLAQFKAIQWQRDVVYVSYGESLFIGTQGTLREINQEALVLMQ